ncbi:hypothetical protein ABZX40_28310 [Streptomyces sp. NPDC004610]|uniref:hypothetical protein n=1 Tax=unclassified Streptomyces TaxID=2593676 RepID=UPI0033B0E5C6
MPDLRSLVSFNDGTVPLYEVRVNDGGHDGGTTSEIQIGGFPGSLTTANLDAAVTALTVALEAVPGFTVVSVNRITAVKTAL